MNIENYIFDFGGVLYEISPASTIGEFARISGLPPEKISGRDLYMKYIKPYEEGMIHEEEFRDMVRRELSIKVSDREFDEIWNLTLKGIYSDSLGLISEFSSFGNLFLMSNTNSIHHNKFAPECRDMFAYFRKLYLSFEVKLIKPDIKFFEFTIHDTEIEASKTLFIDDTLENIRTAEKCGLNVLYIDDRKKLSDLLHNVKFVKH